MIFDIITEITYYAVRAILHLVGLYLRALEDYPVITIIITIIIIRHWL